TCVSIASAGDNSLSLLTKDPAKVIAVDLNPAQLACLELRVAAYKTLNHSELLELIGARESSQRWKWYTACRESLEGAVRDFWDERRNLIEGGIGAAGKFEGYFRLFRERFLPWVHDRRSVERLLSIDTVEEARLFYEEVWNSVRWRWLFSLFFSRTVMGLAGRDPAFFQYVDGPVAPRILERTKHALTEIPPATNPYLHWILTGTYGAALPHALREEHFETIGSRMDRLEWRQATLEDVVAHAESRMQVDAWNLSDIFEYMSEEATETLLRHLVSVSAPGCRLVYWNMLAPRSRPESMADELESLEYWAAELHLRDRAFFYQRFVVEEVRS
ncbi:MAG: DUF3419 family protein, partial [Verrucomicrobiota bacterium]